MCPIIAVHPRRRQKCLHDIIETVEELQAHLGTEAVIVYREELPDTCAGLIRRVMGKECLCLVNLKATYESVEREIAQDKMEPCLWIEL